MYRWFAFYVAGILALVTALSIWGLSGLTREASLALQKWGDAGAAAKRTLDTVNAPCVGYHGSVSCGVLAQASQTAKNVGILAGQATEQVKQSAALVSESSQALQKAGSAVQETAAHLQSTADAATGTLNQATEAVAVTKRTVAKFGPVAESAEIDLDDLDALLKDEAIHRTLANVAGITGSGNAILADAKKVADKEAAEWLKPVPWWKQPIRKGGELIDITAAIARHAP